MTLLDELAKHTVLDIDSNDVAVAELYGKDFFTDMTSNQAIVFSEVTKPQYQHLIRESAVEAQKIVEAGVEGAAGRDLHAVAIDVMTCKLGIAILPYLKSNGRLHAQTMPSVSDSVEGTASHARAIVALYKHYGVSRDRVCIKVPSSVEGLRACAILEAEGIRTLATTIFCEAQAVAAAEAKCLYIAPYLNPLHIQMDKSKHIIFENPTDMDGFQVGAKAQALYRSKGLETQVLAASLVTVEEALCLSGLAHSTLSAPVLAMLANTPQTDMHSKLIDISLKFWKETKPSADAFPLSEPATELKAALADPKIAALQAEAIAIFTDFEAKLFELARGAFLSLGEGQE